MNQPVNLKIALLGNPNTGKTTLFNILAGLNHKTGNYPGVTVEVKKGKGSYKGFNIEWVDLPGTYSMAATSPDEMLAVDLILGRIPNESCPDVLLCLADATNLDRNLYLISQAKELGLPIVVAVTMCDLAKSQSIEIDYKGLSEAFELPFISINALEATGLTELKMELISSAQKEKPVFNPCLPNEIVVSSVELASTLQKNLHPALAMRALLDEGGRAEFELIKQFGGLAEKEIERQRTILRQAGFSLAVIEPRYRYKDIRRRLKGLTTNLNGRKNRFSDKIDKWIVHPVWGLIFFFVVMFLLFQSIFVFSRPLMDLIGFIIDAFKDKVESTLPPGPFTSLMIDGVIPGVGSVIIFLPQIIILFGFLAILEDCGYISRAAFLMDRVMCYCGLSGKSFIPLLSSLACAVPGILSTRVIENKQDRLITILVAPLMSCSARLPVYYLLTEAFFPDPWWMAGFVIFTMYLIGFFTVPLIALIFKGLVFKSEVSIFVLEMPAYRVPTFWNIARRMWDAGSSFVYRAGTLILATMVLLWALLYFPTTSPDGFNYPTALQETAESERSAILLAWKQQSLLGRTGKFLEPIFMPLGWDWRIGMSVLASFPAREVVVAALGVAFGEGDTDLDDAEGRRKLGDKIRDAKFPDGKRVFSQSSALSLLIFFSLCCQCSSTLIVIWRETKSWKWALFTFSYMTLIAYFMAFVSFQAGKALGY